MVEIYDIARLKADADCRDIARQIGMTVKKQFCECPSGLHTETQLNHCSINRTYYHCFSCGDSGDVIHMVQQYYRNKLGQAITMSEACHIIGDCLGGHERYLKENDDRPKERPPFSRQELAVLEETDAWVETRNRFHIGQLQQLFVKDKQEYYRVIRTRATEERQKTAALLAALGGSELEQNLKLELSKRQIQLDSLLKKAKTRN